MCAVELIKRGQRVDLTKGRNVKRVNVALGWDTNRYNTGGDFDLDASVFLLNGNTRAEQDTDFVFYNNLIHPSGAVQHTGDELTGSAEGDDETIKVDFTRMPANIEKLAFVVTIHDAVQRRQNFGMVENAYVRVDDADTGEQLLKFDLAEKFSSETAVEVAEIYKADGEWKFNAKGMGFTKGLSEFVMQYGLGVK